MIQLVLSQCTVCAGSGEELPLESSGPEERFCQHRSSVQCRSPRLRSSVCLSSSQILKAVKLLRVSREEEIQGLDIHEHGMPAYAVDSSN